MATFLIILSVLLWVCSLTVLLKKTIIGPALSFIALFVLSLARKGGFPLLPINSTILIGWLCMTAAVTGLTAMQPRSETDSAKGMGYVVAGALTGMAIGLLATTFGVSLTMTYGAMIIATAAGIFFGYLIYSNTPAGAECSIGSGNFFRSVFAKGFPVAITVMQIGVAAIIALAVYGR